MVNVMDSFMEMGAPEYFSRPWFYILGVACTAVAVWHFVVLRRMPVSLPPGHAQ